MRRPLILPVQVISQQILSSSLFLHLCSTRPIHSFKFSQLPVQLCRINNLLATSRPRMTTPNNINLSRAALRNVLPGSWQQPVAALLVNKFLFAFISSTTAPIPTSLRQARSKQVRVPSVSPATSSSHWLLIAGCTVRFYQKNLVRFRNHHSSSRQTSHHPA